MNREELLEVIAEDHIEIRNLKEKLAQRDKELADWQSAYFSTYVELARKVKRPICLSELMDAGPIVHWYYLNGVRVLQQDSGSETEEAQ